MLKKKSQNSEEQLNTDLSLIEKKKSIPSIIYMAFCALFILVMWCSGFNFLPLVADVLAILTGLIILISVLKKEKINLFIWIAYIVVVAGLFIHWQIWGAESAWKNIWYNFLLCIFPALIAGFIYIADRFIKERKALKITAILCTVLMMGTSVIYVFFMNLRSRPTAESLQAGHDEYLKNLADSTHLGSSSPNVLFILMDDMAFSDISAYSYLGSEAATINTPNIDSIAKDGIMMDNFYSASPVCSPSRFSILTGRYSSRGYLDNVIFPSDIQSEPYSFTHFVNPYQFLCNVDGILGDEITYAEAMQAAGYSTACIGKWNLGDYGEYLPTNQGFDYFYGSYYVNDMTPYTWVKDTKDSHELVRTHKENLDQSESTELFTAECVNFIKTSAANNEKFLCYYTSPWPHFPIFSDNSGNGKGDTSDDTYIQCIEEFDKYVGNILQALKDSGVYDDTLIIFTSDNGPGREGVTGNLRGRKNTTFDGGMKVPCLVSYPNGGVGSGTAITDTEYSYYPWVDSENNPVTNVTRENIGSIKKSSSPVLAQTKHIEASSMNFDLFTTILSYCGINTLPADRIIDGVNLSQLWNAQVPSDHRVHDIIYYQKGGKTQGIQMALELNGKVYDFKYYDRVHTENSAFIDQFYKNYLFNLDLDPAEGYSVSKTYPDIAATCKEQLLAFRKEMKNNRRGKL
ncbi:MAG: sulfatase-like hydrolase/transferase [Clostridia bacterium]|nr:sulfatase-like hydrolase/transferase [Clostridia bacterium]